MGVQIPCGVYPQILTQSNVSRLATVFGRNFPRVGCSQRVSDRRGTSVLRSCAYVDLNTAEVCGVSSGGIYQRKECDSAQLQWWMSEYGRTKVLGQGYYVSTVGHDEARVRRYIQTQAAEDRRIEQLRLSDEW